MARKLLVAIIGLSLFSLLFTVSIMNVFGSNAVAAVQHINNFRASANFVYNGTVDLSLYEVATRLMIEDSGAAAAENPESRSNQTANVTLSSKSQFHERPNASTTFTSTTSTPQTTLMHQSISHNITEATKPNNFRVHCKDKLCSEHLSTADQKNYKVCQSMTKSQPDTNPQCHFMDGKGRDPVALVSVPGSGNTWIRSLLERATGICTGSIYCDRPLRTGGYLAESIRGGSVLVVKTHTSDFQWKGSKIEMRTHDDALYGSAILLIRNPFDTFVAERNRVIALKLRGGRADSGIYHSVPLSKSDDSHTHNVGKEYFSNTSGWDKFIQNIGIRWKKTIDKWFLHPADHPIMVVRYEDLKQNKTTEVKRMLDFLNISYQEEELVQRLELGGENKAFHRHGSVFEHYTVEQKKSINSLLQATIELLQAHHVDHLFKLHEYIADII